jgi:uncharacterized protein (TIGR02246 family)
MIGSSSLTGLVVIALAATIVPGCSSGSRPTVSRLESLAAEPELPSGARARSSRKASQVPVIVSQPRPFRVAELSGLTAAKPQAPLTSRGDAMPGMPTMIATATGGTVRLTSAEEPAHLEAAAEQPSVAEIRDMLTGYLRAFNRHDAAAAASHWAPTAENVNLDSGEVTAGREAVQAVFTSLFTTEPATTIDIDVASIRPVRDDVAVIDGVSRVAYADGEVMGSRFSAVAVRHEGRWLFESVREASSEKVTGSPRPLDELAWLVGCWENVGPGVIAGARCDWAPGGAFLVRWHTVQAADVPAERPRAGDAAIPGLLPATGVTPRELTEIIGFDPERQEIHSWIFSSDGRFGEATWRRDGNAWAIKVEGRGIDAGRFATCTMLTDGADALEYRCEGTGLDGLVPPDCGFTRTSR